MSDLTDNLDRYSLWNALSAEDQEFYLDLSSCYLSDYFPLDEACSVVAETYLVLHLITVDGSGTASENINTLEGSVSSKSGGGLSLSLGGAYTSPNNESQAFYFSSKWGKLYYNLLVQQYRLKRIYVRTTRRKSIYGRRVF